jgi:beta-galactosidase
MKINNINIPVRFRNRRTFLKSLGMAIAGIGFYKPSLLSRNNTTTDGNITSDRAVFSEQFINDSVTLPDGVKAVWNLDKAFREKTATRERISINGLWKWQPGEFNSESVPSGGWGYFKVPGQWHNRIGSRNENQTLYVHAGWKSELPENITTAWYQREIEIPDYWGGRRIILMMEYLNSNAVIYIDGLKAGELWFPGGNIDLTSLIKPGKKYLLSIKVNALPLKDVITAYSDSNMARQIEATVERRGLCGDVYLGSVPAGPRINTVTINTSVAKEEISFKTDLSNLSEGKRYHLQIIISENGNKVTEFTGKTFTANELQSGCFTHTENWIPDKLWDIHTPRNMYMAEISLLDSAKKVMDSIIPVRFGFREFRIEGRDFYLNGSRIWLSCSVRSTFRKLRRCKRESYKVEEYRYQFCLYTQLRL